MNGNGPALTLSRAQILGALSQLNDELAHRSITGELCLFGGAVMVIAFQARISTKDVDAIFQPAAAIRELAAKVGETLSLPSNWLNDGVKGFVSAKHIVTAGNLPQFGNLRLTMPTPEYLLAMKCMASRIGGSQGDADDVQDIIHLIRHLALKSSKDVLNIVADFYPPNRIPVKAQFLVESLFEEGKI
jgi:hypothetical protein